MRYLFAFLFLGLFARADNFLILKTGRKNITFLPKSQIILKTDKGWTGGQLDSIGNDFVIIQGARIPLKNISKVKIYKGFPYGGMGAMLMAGALFFPGIDLFNRAVNHDPLTLSDNVKTLSAGLLGTGILFEFLKARQYPADKNRLIIINPSMAEK